MIQYRWPSIWSVLAVSLTLWVPRSAAQTIDPVCDPSDTKSCVQAVSQGQPVPFTGILMTGRRAAKLAVMADGCQTRIDLAVGEVKEQTDIQVRGIQAMRQNDLSSAKFQRDLLMRKLDESEALFSPRWYERPAFVAAMTAIGTVAVLVVAVRAVEVAK